MTKNSKKPLVSCTVKSEILSDEQKTIQDKIYEMVMSIPKLDKDDPDYFVPTRILWRRF